MSAAAADARAWPKARYAWYVAAMLVVAFTFAIVDRTIISLLVDPIKADLGVTDAQIGLLQGLAFAICYTTFGLALGFVIDRASRRAVLTVGIALWSLATVLCGLAGSFPMLFAARVGVGLGEAAIMPGAASLIADYFPARKRGKAYGIFLLGGSLGVGFGNLMGGIAAPLADLLRGGLPWLFGSFQTWQITFLAVGAPGLLVAAVFWLTVREPLRREKVDAHARVSLAPLLTQLARNRFAYAALMGGGVLNTTSISANSAWLATVFIRAHGWTRLETGTKLALMSIVGATSSITIGWFLAALAKRGRDDGPVLGTLTQSVAQGLLGPVLCLAPSPTAALLVYGVMLLCTNWSSSAVMTGLAQITPNELRGQMVALYTLLTGLVSLSIGTFAVGMLSDRVYSGPAGIAPSLATVLGVSGLCGIATLLAGRAAFCAAAVRARAWQDPA